MTQIRWNNVDALTSTSGVQNAISNVQHQLSALGRVGTDYLEQGQRENWAANQRVKEENTQAYINQLNRINTPEQYDQFVQQGGDNLNALNQWTGNNINSKQVNQALGSWSQDAYNRQSFRDSAKDFTPENQQAMSDYYQAMAVGDVAGAQAAFARGNFSKNTLGTMGGKMYDVLNTERQNNRTESTHIMDLREKQIEANRMFSDAEQKRNALVNDETFRATVLARNADKFPEGTVPTDAQMTELVLNSPEYQEASANVNQYQDLLRTYTNEVDSYVSGNTIPYSPQYQQEYQQAAMPALGSKGIVSQAHTQAAYDVARKHGLTDAQAKAILGNVMAENSFKSNLIFGNHQDGKRRAHGAMSWQGGREKGLFNKLRREGHIDENGRMKDTPEAFAAQIDYLINDEGKNGSERGNFNRFLKYQGNDPVQAARLLDRTVIRSAAGNNAKIATQRDRAYRQVAGMNFNSSNTMAQDPNELQTGMIQEPTQNASNSSIQETSPVDQETSPVDQGTNLTPQQEAPKHVKISDFVQQDGTLDTAGLIKRAEANADTLNAQREKDAQAKKSAIENQHAGFSTKENDYYSGLLAGFGYKPKAIQNEATYKAVSQNAKLPVTMQSAMNDSRFTQNFTSNVEEFDKQIDEITAAKVKEIAPSFNISANVVSTIPNGVLTDLKGKFTVKNKHNSDTETISPSDFNAQYLKDVGDKKEVKAANDLYDRYFRRDDFYDNETIKNEVTDFIKTTKNPALALKLYEAAIEEQYKADIAAGVKNPKKGDLGYGSDWLANEDQYQGTKFLNALSGLRHTRQSDLDNYAKEISRVKEVGESLKNPKQHYMYAQYLANRVNKNQIDGQSPTALKDYADQHFLNSTNQSVNKLSDEDRMKGDAARKVFDSFINPGSDVKLGRYMQPFGSVKAKASSNTPAKQVSPEELQFALDNLHLLTKAEREEVAKKLPEKLKKLKLS